MGQKLILNICSFKQNGTERREKKSIDIPGKCNPKKEGRAVLDSRI